MDELRYLAILLVTAPLLGAIIIGLLKDHLTKNATSWLSCLLVALSFIASAYILGGFIVGKYTSWNETIYVWAKSGDLSFNIGFLIDKLSALMITVVSFVSLMVHIYSIDYMHDDPGYQRFFSYISLFTFAMLMLVMANNFMQLFFGWEAVGLVSYLLIGFWFKKPTAIFAGLKAFIINRVGDLAFIIGIAAVAYYAGNLQYKSVFSAAPQILTNNGAIDLICICLLIGAMAKSAQIPLHVWLPDSMEGPTPISALIHAATMVTAGIFMIARMSPLFENSDLSLNAIMIIGSLTCLLMGILAIIQTDIKRIIAYSTLSQLGYMFVALGASSYAAGIFHLVTHAFFKALLFLGAGSVILAMHHEQNIFSMGNLRKYMPITFVCMIIGTLALMGFPGTSGFYSKDLIIEAVSYSKLSSASFAYIIVLFSVFITAVYSCRLLFVVFFGQQRTQAMHEEPRESSALIWIPLVLLAIPSLFIGACMVSSLLTGFFAEAIYVLPEHNVLSIVRKKTFESVGSMFLHGFISWPFALLVMGAITAWLCYLRYPKIPANLVQHQKLLYRVLTQKYGFDQLNEQVIAPFIRKMSVTSWRIGDVFLIDGFIVNGTAKRVASTAIVLKKLQTGYLYHYVFLMVVGLLSLLLWMFIIRGV